MSGSFHSRDSNFPYDVFPAMGTHLEAVFSDAEPGIAVPLFNQIKQELRRLESKLSRFSPKSMVSRINQEAVRQPVSLDMEMWDLLTLCKEYHHKTCGAFDITMRPSIGMWGLDNLRLNPEKHTIQMKPGMEIDLGGAGKGFALKRIKQIIRTGGIENALVNFGNSSILAMGNHPYGDGWKIGLKSPVNEEKVIFDVTLNNESLSTSGTAHRRLSHLVNPRTGRPVEGYCSFSVITECPLEGDILSTALLIMDSRERQDLFNQFPGIRGVEIYQQDDTRLAVREWSKEASPS